MRARPWTRSSRNPPRHDHSFHRRPLHRGEHSRCGSLRRAAGPGAGGRCLRCRRSCRRPAQHHHRDRQPARGKPAGRRSLGRHARCRHRAHDLRCRCRNHRARCARAGPVRRKLERPRRTALLHPRARQHRFRSRRIAAGLRGDGRCRDGERHAQVLPDLRCRAHRSAARPAGHAVWPQHARRHRQDRYGQAGR